MNKSSSTKSSTKTVVAAKPVATPKPAQPVQAAQVEAPKQAAQVEAAKTPAKAKLSRGERFARRVLRAHALLTRVTSALDLMGVEVLDSDGDVEDMPNMLASVKALAGTLSACPRFSLKGAVSNTSRVALATGVRVAIRAKRQGAYADLYEPNEVSNLWAVKKVVADGKRVVCTSLSSGVQAVFPKGHLQVKAEATESE